MKATRRIVSIKVEQEVDCDADFSDIGEYTDTQSDDVIERRSGEFVRDLPCRDCQKSQTEHRERIHAADCTDYWTCNCDADNCDDWNPEIPERGREYRFFKPFSGGLDASEMPDYATYGKQDYERAEAYERQEWCFVGVYAVARLIVNGVSQTIRSSGLWGIESDSDAAHFTEVGNEQLAELRDTLRALGFSKRAVDTAIAGAEHREAA